MYKKIIQVKYLITTGNFFYPLFENIKRISSLFNLIKKTTNLVSCPTISQNLQTFQYKTSEFAKKIVFPKISGVSHLHYAINSVTIVSLFPNSLNIFLPFCSRYSLSYFAWLSDHFFNMSVPFLLNF